MKGGGGGGATSTEGTKNKYGKVEASLCLNFRYTLGALLSLSYILDASLLPSVSTSKLFPLSGRNHQYEYFCRSESGISC
jgi:hypothetical protein